MQKYLICFFMCEVFSRQPVKNTYITPTGIWINLFFTIYIYYYWTPTFLLLITPSQDMLWAIYKIMQTLGLAFKNSALHLLISHFSAVPTVMHLLILNYKTILNCLVISKLQSLNLPQSI